MDYFDNYKFCDHYYSIYNKFLKCTEYLQYIKNQKFIVYKLNDEYHNIRGPALIGYYDDGEIEFQTFFINGRVWKLFCNGRSLI